MQFLPGGGSLSGKDRRRADMALIYAVEDDKNILEIEMFALKNSGYQVYGF